MYQVQLMLSKVAILIDHSPSVSMPCFQNFLLVCFAGYFRYSTTLSSIILRILSSFHNQFVCILKALAVFVAPSNPDRHRVTATLVTFLSSAFCWLECLKQTSTCSMSGWPTDTLSACPTDAVTRLHWGAYIVDPLLFPYNSLRFWWILLCWN